MYNEPVEARKPKTKWRLYPFKGEQALSKMFCYICSEILVYQGYK